MAPSTSYGFKWQKEPPDVFFKKGVLRNLAGISCEFCEISKSTFSYRTPPVPAS